MFIRAACRECRIGFNILTSKDGEGQVADLVPGAWSERAADAVDLTADGYVQRERDLQVSGTRAHTIAHDRYVKLEPELGRLGLSLGLGLWMLPVHAAKPPAQFAHTKRTALERSQYEQRVCARGWCAV